MRERERERERGGRDEEVRDVLVNMMYYDKGEMVAELEAS